MASNRGLNRHLATASQELVAPPQQVYTWDVTKLPVPTKGLYFDACATVDIYSRYIVGVHVRTRESVLLTVDS